MADHSIRLTTLSAFLVLFVLLLQSHIAISEEVDDEMEFSYEKGSEVGPEHWGHIHKEWAACSKGRMQSPVDLSHERVQVLPLLGRLRRSYRPVPAVLKNRGHDIMLRFEGNAGSVRINGSEYALKQLHWHSPSEHTINGRRFHMELHMVHQTADNRTAVVGILYTLGRSEPFLAKMERYIDMIKDKHEAEEEVGLVDPRVIKRGSRKYYRYMGSLTTPPCTEGVVWTIIKKVRTVSREQVRRLREAVHDHASMNARPIQEINNRGIGLFRPRRKGN
ncbi:alpha carbonic anhydrase 7-like [Zingiber officinale]|uniref:alpha carbonic anhydrase 7-like n=1 Tax=Zingiber officinale TaxID=94328 RepID=UPI001C4BDF30|nr:alpha carbonic anhydrase 7-like [Zingiber officinale]